MAIFNSYVTNYQRALFFSTPSGSYQHGISSDLSTGIQPRASTRRHGYGRIYPLVISHSELEHGPKSLIWKMGGSFHSFLLTFTRGYLYAPILKNKGWRIRWFTARHPGFSGFSKVKSNWAVRSTAGLMISWGDDHHHYSWGLMILMISWGLILLVGLILYYPFDVGDSNNPRTGHPGRSFTTWLTINDS